MAALSLLRTEPPSLPLKNNHFLYPSPKMFRIEKKRFLEKHQIFNFSKKSYWLWKLSIFEKLREKKFFKMDKYIRKCLASWKNIIVNFFLNFYQKNDGLSKLKILEMRKISIKPLQNTIQIMEKDVHEIFMKIGVKKIFSRKFRDETWFRNFTSI